MRSIERRSDAQIGRRAKGVIRDLESSRRYYAHYTFCGRRIPIDLDAMLANLALEEGDERLPQIMDSIRLDPEMLWQTA
jgi:hypothetical protein